MSEITATPSDFAEITSEIVGAYVAKNHVSMAHVPALIRSVHDTLSSLGKAVPVEASAAPLVPAVPIKKSVTDEYLISLEDGRKFKSLKRHLGGLGMTPEKYRAKWGLPRDYPMVAPAYAAKRSALAKTIGLGRKVAVEAAPEPEPEEADATPAEVPKKRGRAKKEG